MKLRAGLSVLLLPFAAVALLLPGCREVPDEDVLFRYRFLSGETLAYRVSLQGGGEVVMTMTGGEEEEDSVSLPLLLEGSYLMEVRVGEVSPEGEAELFLSYRDFRLNAVSRVREREMSTSLSDRGMTISEGERVISESGPGEDDFPLRGIAGEEFPVTVDARGTIVRARTPPAPDRVFPSLQFDAFLDRMQPEFPRAAVPVGSTWSREVEIPGPGPGRPWDQGERWTVRLDSLFREFVGRGRRVALIEYGAELLQEDPADEFPGRSGLRGSRHRLKGEIEFDLAAGRVLSSRSVLEQSLDVRVAFDQALRGRNIEIRVNDTTEVVVRLQQ